MVITCISCSNDDDTPPDLLVGDWGFSRAFINDVEQTISDCDRYDLIKVFANGFYVIFDSDDATGICQTIISDDAVQVTPNDVTRVLTDYPNAAWENLGDGNYKFTLEESGPVQNITLETGNSFSFTEAVGDSIYKKVYIKVPSI